METSDLINKLVKDAKPVKTLAAPVVRMSRWVLLAAACGAIGLWFMGIREDLTQKMWARAFQFETGLLLVLSIWAAFDCLRLSVPGAHSESRTRWLSLSVVGFWIVYLVVRMVQDYRAHPIGAFDLDSHFACAAGIFLIGLIPNAILVRMMVKAYPQYRLTAGALAGIAAGAAATVAVQFVCMRERVPHVVMWHVLPIIISGAIGAGFASIKTKSSKWTAGALLLLLPTMALAETSGGPLNWRPWSDTVFAEAKASKKLVILDLEAVWCHWCHVMADVTYKDPAVVSILKEKYITVRVDQDSRPDISNRYEDYGWPATIVFDGNGRELAKRSGYIPPAPMAQMLQAFVNDPTPGPSVEPEQKLVFEKRSSLDPELQERLESDYVERFDDKNGAWGSGHKFLEWNSVEYAMSLADGGDTNADRMAKLTLDGQLNLLDPAWGGVYQYSTGGVWIEPHFEKIMAMQANNLRIYSMAYSRYKESKYLQAATEIHRFLNTFLKSPEGAFYTSQDADLIKGEHSAEYFALNDQERRKLGVPAVDKHMYARENGWVIQSLAALHGATGYQAYLNEAKITAGWVFRNRLRTDGLFNHDEKDAGGPYLGDSLAMAEASLSLYVATADRSWLSKSEQIAAAIQKEFTDPTKQTPGLLTAKHLKGTVFVPKPLRDEMISAARFYNLLFHYTGKKPYKETAASCFSFLATPEIAEERPVAGVLMANRELNAMPLHVVVVGSKKDAAAIKLYAAAQAFPRSYKRIEWADKSEPALPNQDTEYPKMDQSAAFVCSNQRCSLPAFTPDELPKRIASTEKLP